MSTNKQHSLRKGPRFDLQHVVGALVQYFTNRQTLIAAAVPWLTRSMSAETRPLVGHTSISAAASAVRTPLIAHALVLHSRHQWKGD